MMDTMSKQVERFLLLMGSSTLLITERDRANMDILLTMLGELDKGIICESYGLLGTKQMTLTELAGKYKVAPEMMKNIVEKDIRKIAITPEWQMMKLQFPTLLKKRIETEN